MLVFFILTKYSIGKACHETIKFIQENLYYNIINPIITYSLCEFSFRNALQCFKPSLSLNWEK